MEQEADGVAEARAARFLNSDIHCTGCSKLAKRNDLANFIIMFWDGFDAKTGEPIVRDGIFDDNGRVAVLKACTSCGPKIKAFQASYSATDRAAVFGLNDGPLRKMLLEIWPRIKPAWKFEIGWQIMLPILQKMKQEKIAKSRLQ